MTFTELCERLKQVEETILLELLDINSGQIVDRFEDVVEEKRDYLEDDLELDDVFSDDAMYESDEEDELSAPGSPSSLHSQRQWQTKTTGHSYSGRSDGAKSDVSNTGSHLRRGLQGFFLWISSWKKSTSGNCEAQWDIDTETG